MDASTFSDLRWAVTVPRLDGVEHVRGLFEDRTAAEAFTVRLQTQGLAANQISLFDLKVAKPWEILLDEVTYVVLHRDQSIVLAAFSERADAELCCPTCLGFEIADRRDER